MMLDLSNPGGQLHRAREMDGRFRQGVAAAVGEISSLKMKDEEAQQGIVQD